MEKFKYTVTDFNGNKFPIYADSYAEVVADGRGNSIKSTTRVKI